MTGSVVLLPHLPKVERVITDVKTSLRTEVRQRDTYQPMPLYQLKSHLSSLSESRPRASTS